MPHTAKSQVITDLEATPRVKTNSLERGGVVRSAYETIAAASFLVTTVGQSYPFMRIHKRARLKDIRLTHAAMGNGAVNVTLYRPGTDTAIGSALLAPASIMDSARAKASVITTGSISVANAALDIGTLFATQIGTAGATADTEFDIAIVVATVSTGAAVAVGMEIEYVLPE